MKSLGLQPKQPVSFRNAKAEAEIAETRAALAAQQARLDEDRKSFQTTQQETLKQIADLAAQTASRQAAPQGLSKTEAPQISSDTPDDDGEENLDALRRGRRGLRIDLQASSAGYVGSGLNVPRG
jgi:multidrug efflux pump subunit AcrA (membrane-fusion protein)